MKKMININFQGRIIPIEETAYELLKNYVQSLRKYFINEEGREEIINDIESRIAELFNNRLKNGAVCIADDDVNAVIASIGRPQDFEELNGNADTTNSIGGASTSGQQQTYQYTTGTGRLVRNIDDTIIAGVCSGLANNLKVDPVIVRILFVVFLFTLGIAIPVYIILWIVLPSQSIKTNITKRLYRSKENKTIAGVCSGLAAYFKIDIWIPRLIFALPLLISIFDSVLWNNRFDFDFFPNISFISGSLSGTMFFIYIVLWIVLPEATTAAEKLELKGERIDLNSIRDTIKEDLQGVKTKAQQMGQELKEAASDFTENAGNIVSEAKQSASTIVAETAPVIRNTGSGLSNIFSVLLKIFLFLIIGSVAIAIFGALVGLFGAGLAVMPFKSYLLESGTQNILAWASLLLFLGIPILAFIIWIIRRIAGVKSKKSYLSYAFTALWLIGLFCFIGLVTSVSSNFRYPYRSEQNITLLKPLSNKVIVKVAKSSTRYYGSFWNNNNFPWGVSKDSLQLRNISVMVSKSDDSSYHLVTRKYSNGKTPKQAEEFVNAINFGIDQQDSLLYLNNGFTIPKGSKFRNQHILVNIQVPVGKLILIDRSVSKKFDRFHLSFGGNNNWDWDEDRDWDYHWNDDVEYIMTPRGLELADKIDDVEIKKGKIKLNIKDGDEEIEGEFNIEEDDEENRYRYKQLSDSIKLDIKQKIKDAIRNNDNNEQQNKEKKENKRNVSLENDEAESNEVAGVFPLSLVNRLRYF